jgi:hypothetical protein
MPHRITGIIGLLVVLAALPTHAGAQYRREGTPPDVVGFPAFHSSAGPATYDDDRAIAATLAAAGGSFVGFVGGLSMVYGTRSAWTAILVMGGATWGGAALGAGLVTGNGSGAAVGSLVGLLAGFGVASVVAKMSDGTGAVVTFSLVHGLVTAAMAR